MSQPRSTVLIIALVLLNASANFIGAIGMDDYVGVDPEPGGDEAVDDLENSSRDIKNSSTGSSVATLISLITAGLGGFVDIIPFVFDGPKMMANLGVPDAIVTFVFAPLYVIVAIDIIGLMMGRDT